MKIADTIKQMLLLPEDAQEEYQKAVAKRKQILFRMERWKDIEKSQKEELNSIRFLCTHPLETQKSSWDTDEYGKMLDTGYIDYICPDCGARRTENF